MAKGDIPLRRLRSPGFAVALCVCVGSACGHGASSGTGAASGSDGAAVDLSGRELSLRLEADRAEYRIGESLRLHAYLFNHTKRPMMVLRRATHVDLGLDAQNEVGVYLATLPPPEPPPPPERGDLAILPPGASVEFVDWELLGMINREILAGKGRKGRFTVRATYRADPSLRKLDPDTWVGELRSNAIEIVIREAL
jgi:hypothetical protein